MKRILLPLALMSALLVSCEKPENNKPEPEPDPEYSISISPTELIFGAEGGDQTVKVTATYGEESSSWNMDRIGFYDWCEVSISSYDNGGEVTFTVEPYDNPDETRTATFTFFCGDKEEEFTVTQEAKVYSISVEPAELTFEADGGEAEVSIVSSDEWEISDVPSWIEVSEPQGENGATIMVSAEYNAGAESRSGEIVFTCGNKEAKVSVSQKEDDSPIIQFKDPYFLEALLKTYTVTWDDVEYYVDVDKNDDGQISEKEASSVEVLDLSMVTYETGQDIRNVDELSYFTGLIYLDLAASLDSGIESLDLSKNTALTELRCYSNQLTSLDLSSNTALTELNCSFNQLTSLDLSSNTALTELDCGYNQLTSLDLSSNTALTELDCGYNQLTSLDLSSNTALTYLSCYSNELTSLDLSSNTALTELDCYSNQLTSLDLSSNTALTELDCDNNQLTSLDVSRCASLTTLRCTSNGRLVSIDVSGCYILEKLYCVGYYIRYDDFGNERFNGIVPGSKLPLESLRIYKYHIIDEANMQAIEEAYERVIEYVEKPLNE